MIGKSVSCNFTTIIQISIDIEDPEYIYINSIKRANIYYKNKYIIKCSNGINICLQEQYLTDIDLRNNNPDRFINKSIYYNKNNDKYYIDNIECNKHTDNCIYCSEKRCVYKECLFMKQDNLDNCGLHKCSINNCNNDRYKYLSKHEYCIDHTCFMELDNEYPKHYCYKYKERDNWCCSNHMCKYRDCNKYVTSYQMDMDNNYKFMLYCRHHKCIVERCNRIKYNKYICKFHINENNKSDTD